MQMSVFNARSNVDSKSREKNSSRAMINKAEFRERRDGMEIVCRIATKLKIRELKTISEIRKFYKIFWEIEILDSLFKEV